jgi:hypothetical protein
MRSAEQASEDLLARLFTDAEFRARFRRDPRAMGRELGLDAAALASLENTDWVGLELAAHSYAHKRDARAGRKRRWWSFR